MRVVCPEDLSVVTQDCAAAWNGLDSEERMTTIGSLVSELLRWALKPVVTAINSMQTTMISD